jgi:deazaflavin-dependent oxidoreductase (nitroreductase family)
MAQDDEVVISPQGWVAEQIKVYLESGGTRGNTLQGAPCLLLDYRGRRTGQWRRTCLIFGRDGDDYLVVASKGGADDHPLWYVNLEAGPAVRVQDGAERFTARAETVTAEDKPPLWERMVDIFPPYADYQLKTSRDIPVVRLRRTEG